MSFEKALFPLEIRGRVGSNTTQSSRGLSTFVASINTNNRRIISQITSKPFFALDNFMSLSEYFIVDDARTASLRMIIDKLALTSFTTEVDFENYFKDTPPLKRGTLMM